MTQSALVFLPFSSVLSNASTLIFSSSSSFLLGMLRRLSASAIALSTLLSHSSFTFLDRSKSSLTSSLPSFSESSPFLTSSAMGFFDLFSCRCHEADPDQHRLSYVLLHGSLPPFYVLSLFFCLYLYGIVNMNLNLHELRESKPACVDKRERTARCRYPAPFDGRISGSKGRGSPGLSLPPRSSRRPWPCID